MMCISMIVFFLKEKEGMRVGLVPGVQGWAFPFGGGGRMGPGGPIMSKSGPHWVQFLLFFLKLVGGGGGSAARRAGGTHPHPICKPLKLPL